MGCSYLIGVGVVVNGTVVLIVINLHRLNGQLASTFVYAFQVFYRLIVFDALLYRCIRS